MSSNENMYLTNKNSKNAFGETVKLITGNLEDEAWTHKHKPHSRRMIPANKNSKYKMIRNNNTIQISDSMRI